jgi:hypothetical protein
MEKKKQVMGASILFLAIVVINVGEGRSFHSSLF